MINKCDLICISTAVMLKLFGNHLDSRTTQKFSPKHSGINFTFSLVSKGIFEKHKEIKMLNIMYVGDRIHVKKDL